VLSRPMPDRPGVDIKADGGYVVAPPSRHPRTGRPYRVVGDRPVVEMPPPLLGIVTAEPAPQRPPTGQVINPAGFRSAGGISSPDALLAANLRAVADAPVGKRRTTLYGAARGVARMVAVGAIPTADAVAALTETGRAAEQTERDIRSAITGGFHHEGIAA
ncbi:MAG: bifunctional DNA primase/polymerase, partial [Micromonosporaceae bacterium]